MFSPRSLAVGLAALPWGLFRGRHLPSFTVKTLRPRPAAPAADLAKRVKKLDTVINQRSTRARSPRPFSGPGEARPPRGTLGKDHWQTGDARRDLETYHRLAGLPREIQDRYAKSRKRDPGESALCPRPLRRGPLLFQEDLSIRRDILGEDHPTPPKATTTWP